MNTKHTPGQWEALLHANGAFDILATDEKGAELALANKGSMTSRAAEMHANARLMAAAPELLAALIETARCLEWHSRLEWHSQHRGVGMDAVAVKNARAAIARATGA